MPKITLYGKAGCCLCEDARRALDDLARTHEFELAEVDIALDPVLMRRYGERIPVVAVDGRDRLELRVAFADLRDLLDRLAA
ncbi:MAG: glutaredoxin family protein [Thermoleophilaceae bacterium]|nr:glutaredoxin family protein [Thermoleophilaceae bacterium]